MIPVRKKKAPTHNAAWRFLTLIPVLVVAVVCYSVTVYAWYQDRIFNTGSILRAANYDLEVSVKQGETIVSPEDGVYSLNADQKYTVTLTAAEGGASTGYCVMRASSSVYYTAPIPKGGIMSFTLAPEQDVSCTFMAVWGSAGNTENIIQSGAEVSLGEFLTDNVTAASGGEADETEPETTKAAAPAFPDSTETVEPPLPAETEGTSPESTSSETTAAEATTQEGVSAAATPETTESTAGSTESAAGTRSPVTTSETDV